MDKIIKTAIDMHVVRDESAHQVAHVAEMAMRRGLGIDIEVHDSVDVVARVDHGRWITDCECGAGNAAHPDWGEVRCFGCGAVHKVTFPERRKQIEGLLLARPVTANRNWLPGETVKDLRRENEEHGIGVS